MTQYSVEYLQHLKQGPFPGRIDPWAEIGYYFQQIHGGMIDQFLAQVQDKLLLKGYIAQRESSLQIANYREPDLTVTRFTPKTGKLDSSSYAAAAEALNVDAGLEAVDELELQALYIRHMETGTLVTVVEIISPTNKVQKEALSYREYRALLLSQGVNFVEVDPTRSIKRLLETRLTQNNAYHIAVYLPGEPPRVIGINFGEALKTFALPLQNEVIEVDTQSAYTVAYQRTAIAAQIEKAERYHENELPFPSTLTPEQRQQLLEQLHRWLNRLNELRISTD